jgi:hypothetical protein
LGFGIGWAWIVYTGFYNLAIGLYALGNPADSMALLSFCGVLLVAMILQGILAGVPRERRVPNLLWISPIPRWMISIDSIFSAVLFCIFLMIPLVFPFFSAYPIKIYAYWIILVPLWLSLVLWNRMRWVMIPTGILISFGLGFLSTRIIIALAQHNQIQSLLSANDSLVNLILPTLYSNIHTLVTKVSLFLAPFRFILLATWPIHLVFFGIFSYLIFRAAEKNIIVFPRSYRHLKFIDWMPIQYRSAVSEQRRVDFFGIASGVSSVGIALALWQSMVFTLQAAYFGAVWRFFLSFWVLAWRRGLPLEDGIFAVKPNPLAYKRKIWQGRVIVLTVSVVVFLLPSPWMLLWSIPGAIYALLLVRYGIALDRRMYFWLRFGLHLLMIPGLVILNWR